MLQTYFLRQSGIITVFPLHLMIFLLILFSLNSGINCSGAVAKHEVLSDIKCHPSSGENFIVGE